MKRYTIATLSLALCLLSLPALSQKVKKSPTGKSGESNLTQYVNPFIGTGGHGHTYPGASFPFGMVQLSPDTRLTGWDGCSAYHYSDSLIYGFSHTHLSGTGCSDYGDILIMPTTGKVKVVRGEAGKPKSGYSSTFSHKNEVAQAGYYSVVLDDYHIKAELTATARTGFHKYTFPLSKESNIIIDLQHRDEVIESSVTIVSNTEIQGMRRSRAWAEDQQVFFVARFSKPFTASGVALNDELKNLKTAYGKNVKAFVTFNTYKGEVITVKVGISGVSIDGARRNLEAEIGNKSFETIRTSAGQAWNKELNKIVVEGGSNDQKTIFYTALYHAMLNPNLYMDVDGKYRGRDLKIHQAKGFENYTVFSLWDTYRAAHPLYTIIEQKRTADFINTFLVQYQQGGMLPVWELSANETGCMIGYHAVPVIADALMKGIGGFDASKALEAVKHSAEQDHLGLKFYKTLGYIPSDEEGEAVSKTLEYAYDDWCIAQMAKKMGKNEDYKTYIRRAQYYKNLFDPTTGFMRARKNGSLYSPFDPAEVNFNYTEANAWQYSFYVPQDITNWSAMLGGKAQLATMLDGLFAAKPQTTGRDQADITGLIGQYAHGNEPSHQIAYLYDYAGQPWKTQEKVHEIVHTLYHNQPDGLSGNEDCGQMSAWLVLSAMGFYPVTPASDFYAIGTPLFDKVTIHLENGKQFVIKANNLSDNNFYVSASRLNGAATNHCYLRHSDLMKGGELQLDLASQPNKAWGSTDGDAPVSAITDNFITPNPMVEKGDRVFYDSTLVVLGCANDKAKIYYTLDDSQPSESSSLYSGPFLLTNTSTLKTVAYVDHQPSFTVTSCFNKIPKGRTLRLNTRYSNSYTAGGDIALIDGIYGKGDFHTGSWQGYQGVDVNAVVNLGKSSSIHKLAIGFNQDMASWILMPVKVDFYVSFDDVNYKLVGTVVNDIPADKEGGIIKTFTLEGLNLQAQFVKVVAKNPGVLPPSHPSAGEKSWIFADEITIE